MHGARIFALRGATIKKNQTHHESDNMTEEEKRDIYNAYRNDGEEERRDTAGRQDLMDLEFDSFKMDEQGEQNRYTGKSKYSEMTEQYFTPVNAKINPPGDGNYWDKNDNGGDPVMSNRVTLGVEKDETDAQPKRPSLRDIDNEKWTNIGANVAFGALPTQK
jgi:hypothetical protein